MAKIPTLYHDWLRSISKKRVDYFELNRREGGMVKTFAEVHKMPRYLLIYYKILFAVIKPDFIFYRTLGETIIGPSKIC